MRSILFLVLIAKFSFAGEVNIKAKVSKEQVRVGEVFEYQIMIEGGLRSTPKLLFPDLKNFKVVSRQQLYNYQLEKGKIKASLTYKFSLVALREGEFEIKGVKLRFGLKEYKVKSLKIKVKGIKEIPKSEPSPAFKKEEGIWI